jgi:SAM-dependent methyltransferase
MARFGAARVVGCDISASGLEDARRRVADNSTIEFMEASVLDLPFPDESFDFCWSAGVLHHTADPDKGLAELTRVLKPGGKLFVLLYGKGGVRWPTIVKLRPLAQRLGYDVLDNAMKTAAMPANKQRTFLDDLFVPLIAFYDWDEIQAKLRKNGYSGWHRFENARLDHEASPAVQREELVQLRKCFDAVGPDGAEGVAVVDGSIADLDEAEHALAAGAIAEHERDWRVFGWGHHRLIADKASPSV